MGSQIRLLAFGFIFEVKLEVEEGAFPAKSRHYYPPPPTTGTREALMERRAAPYPYSKMCELCELCELLERKIPPLPRWDLLYLSAAEFSGSSDEASSCAISCDFLSESKRAARA